MQTELSKQASINSTIKIVIKKPITTKKINYFSTSENQKPHFKVSTAQPHKNSNIVKTSKTAC